MKMTSFRINGRSVSRLSINGREVSLGSVHCDALCFTAKYNQATVKLTKVGNPDSINLQTSFDGKSWTPYNVEDVITVPNAGGKVYFKAVGSNNRMAKGPSDHYKFVSTSELEASGNVNSLLEEDETVARTMSLYNNQFCYVQLFSYTHLTKAPELPSTEIGQGCYAMMFSGCLYLTQAPKLPATTLAGYCYYQMFNSCTALTTAPELPAYTLVDSCYTGMFAGCSQLNYVSVGFDNWVQFATDNWLPNNTGTFQCPQTLIDNTTERSNATVPQSWTMVAV